MKENLKEKERKWKKMWENERKMKENARKRKKIWENERKMKETEARKKKKKTRKKKKEKKEKEGPKGYPPRRAQKLIFYIRTVKRNRNEIEARKKSDFWVPYKQKENEKKWKKMKENLKNERK